MDGTRKGRGGSEEIITVIIKATIIIINIHIIIIVAGEREEG